MALIVLSAIQGMSAIGRFHCIYNTYLRNDVAQSDRENGIFEHKN